MAGVDETNIERGSTEPVGENETGRASTNDDYVELSGGEGCWGDGALGQDAGIYSGGKNRKKKATHFVESKASSGREMAWILLRT